MPVWKVCRCGNPIIVPDDPIHHCRDCNNTLCEWCCEAEQIRKVNGIATEASDARSFYDSLNAMERQKGQAAEVQGDSKLLRQLMNNQQLAARAAWYTYLEKLVWDLPSGCGLSPLPPKLSWWKRLRNWWKRNGPWDYE